MNWQDDHHFDWIKLAVPGWCDDKNIEAMSYAVEGMPSGAVIEIGSFVGRSTCVISRLLEISGRDARFFSVDDWYFEGFVKGGVVSTHITHDSFREYVERQFRTNVEYFTGRRPFHLKMRSDEFFRGWSEGREEADLFDRRVTLGGEIAFAFVDGDHSYEGSKRDLFNVIRLLAPGGLILIDDSYPGAPHECRSVAEELLGHADLTLFGRYPNIMLQKKRLSNAPAMPFNP